MNKKIAPTSCPFHIIDSFIQAIDSNDRHNPKIKENKAGLVAGAGIQLEKGVIDAMQFAEITELINQASLDDFEPILYVIPKEKVSGRINRVEVSKRANPLGVEFQIIDLVNTEFDAFTV